ncbi:MAG: C-GCAxxG-C-C family protein [Acutalibacteraceae bacterium]
MMDHVQRAKALFMSGLNCSQAVFLAFSDELGIDETTAKRISIGLGGGVGRMREICGAVSGAAMVLGAVYGGRDGTNKAGAYGKIKLFAEKFKEKNKYIVCRELRGFDRDLKESSVPDDRTKEYYQTRPCVQLVCDAASIVQDILSENKS